MHTCKLIFLIFLCTPFLLGDDELQFSPQEHRENVRAISLGLGYICSKQKKDGSFGEKKYAIAITSFVGITLLAAGHQPQRGKYGKELYKALLYIISRVNKSGYVSDFGEESKMHGHCYAALFLAQIYGTSRDYSDELGGDQNLSYYSKNVHDALKKVTQTIITSQTTEGGWGYMPHDKDHEGSITVCAIQALRAARNVGIRVPKQTIDRAITYIKRSANQDGTFKYRLNFNQRRQSFPLTAAGVSSLNGTGEYDTPEIKRGLRFMMLYLPPNGKIDQYYNRFFYYGHFYAVQAMFQAPSHTGYWEKWYPAVRRLLLKLQRDSDGSWGNSTPFNRVGESSFGTVYATAIATLILQVPYKYLPIFQK